MSSPIRRHNFIIPEGYKPLKPTIEFFLWFKEFANEENKTPKIHFLMVDNLYKRSKQKTRVYECFRGSAKSTIITCWSPIYWAYKGYKPNLGATKEKSKVYLVYIASATIDLAKSHIDRIAHLINTNEKLNAILEIAKMNLSDYPMIIIRNRLSGHETIIEGKAPNQKTRGKSTKGRRVDVIICDDLEDEENVKTEGQRQSLAKFINRVLLPMRNPNTGEFHYIQTPVNPFAPLFTYKKHYPENSIHIPVCINFEPGKEIPESDLAWSDRFTSDYIQATYRDLSADDEKAFFQEFLLQVRDEDDMPLDPDRIKWKDEIPYDECDFYLIVDFASSAKKSSDFYGYVGVAVNKINGEWYIMYVERGRYTFTESVKHTLDLLQMLPLNTALVTEKGLLWNIAEDIIIAEADARDLFFEIFTVAKNQQSKHKLILMLENVMHKLYWATTPECDDGVTELKEQMRLITKDSILSKYDDLIDPLATLMLISDATVMEIGEKEDEIEDSDEEKDYRFNPYMED